MFWNKKQKPPQLKCQCGSEWFNPAAMIDVKHNPYMGTAVSCVLCGAVYSYGDLMQEGRREADNAD